MQVLAEMADGEFGDERSNLVTAFLGIAEQLAEEVQPVAQQLAESLAGFEREQGLDDDHLPGTLAVALYAGPRYEAQVQAVVEDDRLFSDPDRVRRVFLMLDRIPDDLHNGIFDRAKPQLTADPTILLDPVEALPQDEAGDLLRVSQTWDGVASAIGTWESNGQPDEITGLAEALYERAAARSDPDVLVSQCVEHLLIEQSPAYSVVRRHADSILKKPADQGLLDADAIIGLRVGPPEDWEFWTGHLAGNPQPESDEAASVAATAQHIVGQLRGLEAPMHEAAVRAAMSLAPYLAGISDEHRETLGQACQNALNGGSWWTTDEELAVQRQIHEYCRALGREAALSDGLNRLVVDDLRRGLSPAPPHGSQWSRPQTQQGLRDLGSRLGRASAQEILQSLMDLGTSGDPDQDLEIMHTRAVLAATAKPRGERDPSVVDHDVLIQAAAREASALGQAASAWLGLDPDSDQVEAVAVAAIQLPSALRGGLRKWSERQDEEARSTLVTSLTATDGNLSDWIREISDPGVDETSVLAEIAHRVGDAAHAEKRSELIGSLVAVSPRTPAGQKTVADQIIQLLGTGKAVDFDIALRAVPALGDNHRSAARLKTAFKHASEDHGHKVSKKGDLKALERVGVQVPKKSLTDSARDFLKSIRSD